MDKLTVPELLARGESCSQVMMRMTMMLLGVEDELLPRAMSGLGGGMGYGHACGIVTGAACAFGLAAGEEKAALALNAAFYEWFFDAYGEAAGGIHCLDLLDGDMEQRFVRCPSMIARSWKAAEEILRERA